MMFRYRIALTSVVLLGNVTFVGCNRSGGSDDALAKGRKYLEAKDHSHARLYFKIEQRSHPQNPEVYFLLGQSHLATGELPTAVAYYRKAIEFNPKHLGAQKALAHLMVRSVNKNVLTQAKTVVQSALAESPEDSDLLQLLGSAELRLGERDAGERHLLQVLGKFPQHLRSAMSLASLKLVEGDREPPRVYRRL
jgi:cytochrome c-type biogenesis protein CcmH/NrfG